MKTTRRAHSLLKLLVLLFAVVATVYAQDAGNDTTPAPTTVTPVPTTLPPTKKPTPAPQTPSTESSGSDAEGDADATKTPKPTPPPANEAAANTPPPTVTSEIDVDRSNKAEYSTRAPTASNETSTSTTGESTASKMTSWLVPSIIAAVIVIAVVFMSLFVRDRRRSDDDDGTPRRTDLFFEHPRTNTNHVPNVPVLGDTVQPAKEKDQSSMRTVAVGGAPHPPRKNQQRPSSPQLDDFNRPSSPGFGTYKQKPMEGSSVVF